MIYLPTIKEDTSGLVMSRGKWCMLYHEDDKLRRISTGSDDINTAIIFRDLAHQRHLAMGAEYKTRSKPTLQAAIENPKGMDGIYEVVSYRVVLDGVAVGTSSDPEKARQIRNKHIEENYENTKT